RYTSPIDWQGKRLGERLPCESMRNVKWAMGSDFSLTVCRTIPQVMTYQPTDDEILNNTVLFCRALRERGLLATPSEAIDAVTTLSLIDLDDRQETFLSLRSVLTSRVEDFPVFEELFEGFWNGLGRSPQPRKIIEREEGSTGVRLSSRKQGHKGLAFFLEHW